MNELVWDKDDIRTTDRFTWDVEDLLFKFNPHHDERGRFAERPGMSAADADRSLWPPHIQELRVPPAWTDVQIADDPDADLLVVGKDAKGRYQYIYSEKFMGSQAELKYERIRELQEKYDGIARQNNANMSSNDPTTREHAEAMALVMTTGIRPGSDKETFADQKAYGATTLEGRHVKTGEHGEVVLNFVGKKGVTLTIPVEDRMVADIVSRRATAAGKNGRLFPSIDNRSLSEYASSLDGGSFHTKDFRTALGTRTALSAIAEAPTPTSPSAYKKAVRAIAKAVSKKLGNTPTVALQSYIDPTVFGGWRSAAGV